MAFDSKEVIGKMFTHYTPLAKDYILNKIKDNKCGITFIYPQIKESDITICLHIDGTVEPPVLLAAKLPDLKLEDWVTIDFSDVSDLFDDGDVKGLKELVYETFFPKPNIEEE